MCDGNIHFTTATSLCGIYLSLCSISGISEIFEKRGVYDSRVQTAEQEIATSFVRFQGNENYDTQCTEAWVGR